MAKQKKPKRLSSVPRRAKILRNGDPDDFDWQDELADFFQDRADYIRAYSNRIGDFLEISPMPLVYGWRHEIPDTGRRSLLTKQEKATRKGRIVEARRRAKAKAEAAKVKAAQNVPS